ncbi:MAG: hypothetical protein WB526_13070 [Candidatus Cybelea sp.]
MRTADAAADTLYAALHTYPEGAYVSKLADHLWAAGTATSIAQGTEACGQ